MKKKVSESNLRKVVFITGMSGSGRSVALKTLEDMGYETIDNLPISLLETVAHANRSVQRPLGISIDVRTRDFAATSFLQKLEKLTSDPEINTQLVFFDCDDDVLSRRYNESRRLHPLAQERPVIDGIRLERSLIEPLRDFADIVIDTSLFTTVDLKGQLRRHFLTKKAPGLSIYVMSFSYRHGLPREADMVFDARLLKNPFYDEELRPFSGEDSDVAAFIEKDKVLQPYLTTIKTLLSNSLPRFEEEGRSYLTIAVGCTGGQHRSVFIAKTLAEWLQSTKNNVKLKHRDLKKRKAT